MFQIQTRAVGFQRSATVNSLKCKLNDLSATVSIEFENWKYRASVKGWG